MRDASARSGVKSSLTEVARRFPDGVPLLDPIEDMSVKSDVLPGLISKIITLQDRLEKSPFNTAKDKGERYSQYQRKVGARACICLLFSVNICIDHNNTPFKQLYVFDSLLAKQATRCRARLQFTV